MPSGFEPELEESFPEVLREADFAEELRSAEAGQTLDFVPVAESSEAQGPLTGVLLEVDGPLVSEEDDVPAYIAGDAEVAAVAEFGRGESDSGSSMLYVKVDDRIAVGAITADRLNRTAKHGGDLTHLAIPGWEMPCTCGRTGCLGTRVSMIQILGPDYLGMSTEGRERLAAETAPKVDEAAHHLGEALAATVVALDIDRVVIGGQLAGWPSVPEHVAAGIDAVAGWAPEVTVTALGSSAVLLGSAAMVLSGELGVVWA